MHYLNIEEWMEEPLIIKVHVAVAILAFVIGAVTLMRQKGTNWHRFAGRAFVVLAFATAATSLFIHEIRLWGLWSPIHLLSLIVIYALWKGVQAIRRGDVATHVSQMRQVYFFGFVVAGAFTLLPGRTMGEVLLERGFWVLSGGSELVMTALSWSLPIAATLFSLWALFLRRDSGAGSAKPRV